MLTKLVNDTCYSKMLKLDWQQVIQKSEMEGNRQSAALITDKFFSILCTLNIHFIIMFINHDSS